MQVPKRAMLNGFDGTKWFMQYLRNFLITPVFQIFERDNLLLIGCQAAERRADLTLPHMPGGFLFGDIIIAWKNFA